MPFFGLTIESLSFCSLSSLIGWLAGEWCFWYESMIWLTRGQSDGRNEQAISNDLECQNSDSGSFSSALNVGSSLSYKMNRISVETQK